MLLLKPRAAVQASGLLRMGAWALPCCGGGPVCCCGPPSLCAFPPECEACFIPQASEGPQERFSWLTISEAGGRSGGTSHVLEDP